MIAAHLTGVPSERLFAEDVTATDLLTDLDLAHLRGAERRQAREAVRRERHTLAMTLALEGVRDVAHYRKLWKDECVLRESVELRALENADKLEAAVTNHIREVSALVEKRQIMVTAHSDLLRRTGDAEALVGGQDDDTLEQRLQYALAVGGSVSGETLTNACSRASAERDDLAVQLAHLGDALEAAEADVDRLERESSALEAALLRALRPWWRRWLDWWAL